MGIPVHPINNTYTRFAGSVKSPLHSLLSWINCARQAPSRASVWLLSVISDLGGDLNMAKIQADLSGRP